MRSRWESALDRLLMARGAAYGDLDDDGDQDIVINQNGRPALLLRNDQILADYPDCNDADTLRTDPLFRPRSSCWPVLKSGRFRPPLGWPSRHRQVRHEILEEVRRLAAEEAFRCGCPIPPFEPVVMYHRQRL